MPTLYIIAGPNGAGKTTASYKLLPTLLDCKEYVNADEIARGLSPFNPGGVAIEAGRIMLGRVDELINHNETFAFETTLATRSYVNTIKECKSKGYEIMLIFFWLNSPRLARERVQLRVANGGHDIPVEVIERRYSKGLKNLVTLFIQKCDYWIVADNSDAHPVVIAEGSGLKDISISNEELWKKIDSYGA